MNKSLIPLFVCLSCISVAQAVDYQGPKASVSRSRSARYTLSAVKRRHEQT